jgi:twinkle protein
MSDDLEMLTALGLNKFLDPSNLVDAVVDRRNNPVKGIGAPWSKLEGMFEIPRQGVTLLGGYSGHQKSTLANQWALHAAATGHKVCVASLELTTEYLFDFFAGQSACMTDMHEDYLRRFGQWADDKLFIVDHHDVMNPAEVITLIQDAKRLLGADLFVLDCLFQVDTGGELEHEKRFMQQLAVTARDYEIGIMVVHHMRKSQGPEGEKRVPNKHDFIGSSHLTNAAAAVLILWENKQKSAKRSNGEEVDDDDPDFILSVAKNRFGPYEGAIGLYKHEKARLLCNSRARQYKPIILEDTCESKRERSGAFSQEADPNGLLARLGQETTPATDSTTSSTVCPL